MDEDQRTIYCCNLSDRVDEELIYELFLQVRVLETVIKFSVRKVFSITLKYFQAGPIERVSMPKDQRGDPRGIAFIEYAHQVSVPYALQLFVGTKLCNRPLNLRSRNNSNPVQITPQHIEANNPLTMPSSYLRRGPQGNSHMQPGYGRHQPAPIIGNPFELTDPTLLLALTANFQGPIVHPDLGQYEQRASNHGHREDGRGNKHRGHSYRSHDHYNPYKNNDDRDRGHPRDRDRERDRDHDRNWTNGSQGSSSHRRRF